jgi:hypothetical protein
MKKKKEPEKNDLIFESLIELGKVKHDVIENTKNVFTNIKFIVKQIYLELDKKVKAANLNIELSYTEKSNHEIELKFIDDTLIFSMHSNVFKFDSDHQLWQTNYFQNDNTRAYTGMILMYNFLSDSFKFNRNLDTGYLIGRIFINNENHIYVDGKRQLGFLYNDIENSISTEKLLNDIIESAIIYSINFESLVPPYEFVKELTVQQKIEQSGTLAIQTSKRLGFRFSDDKDS